MKNHLKEREKLLKNILSNFKSMGLSIIPPDTRNAIKKVEKRINKTFNQSLKSFYTLCDGYTINWQGYFEDFAVKGQSSVRPVSILDSLNIGNNKSLSFSNIDVDNEVVIESLLIFDIIDNLGNYVLIKVRNDEFILYLYTYNKKLNKLNLSIGEYLKMAQEFFGAELWQQFYIKNPANISEFYIYDNRYSLFFERFLEKETFHQIQKALQKLNSNQSKPNGSIDFRNNFDEKLDSLKHNKSFKLIEAKIKANISANYIIKSQESLNKELPNSMIDFYLQMNGIKLEWKIDKTIGKLNFLPLEEIFGGSEWYSQNDWSKTNYHKSTIWIGENVDDEYYNITRQLRPLEIFTGDSGYIGFMYNDSNEFEIYYAYNRDALMKLPITIDKYLELSIRLLGLEGWQEYYRHGKEAKIGDAYLMDEILNIFPDFKIEEFM